MLKQEKVSIIIPSLNEEQGLNSILATMPCFIDEIIVVDNLSTDKSVEAAKMHGAKVIIERTKGYGRVLLRGLECITGDIAIIIDGDGSYGTKSLEGLCSFMQNNEYDFVSGCRFPLDNPGAMPFINRFANYFISWIIRIIYKINLKDSQSGLMIFRRDILERINVLNPGMGISQEIKVKAWLNSGIRCGEKHIPYHKRLGTVKFRKIRDGYRNLFDVFRLFSELKNKR